MERKNNINQYTIIIIFRLCYKPFKIMGTYWNEFINRYNDKIPYTTLSIMLEAYYYYIANKVRKADDLMGKL